MLKFNKKNFSGFTLIETLIYSFLLSFIIIAALSGIYQIISSADKLSIKSLIEQEGNFLLRKINWALTGADSISLPLVNSSGQTLLLNKEGLGSLEFTLSGDKLKLSRNGGVAVDLSSDYFKISDLNFSYNDPDGTGGKPGEIKVSFKVNDQLFETTKYLRK